MKKIRLFLIDIDPHYLELAFRYLSSTQDVEVVGYASDAARALALIGQEGYTFPVFYDTEMSASTAYGVYSLPTTYFIDAQGYAVAQARGAISAETLQKGIDMSREEEKDRFSQEKRSFFSQFSRRKTWMSKAISVSSSSRTASRSLPALPVRQT